VSPGLLEASFWRGAKVAGHGLRIATPRDVRPLAIFLLSSCVCGAQAVSIGVAGGGRATDDVSAGGIDESKRYVFGPKIEVGLPWNFAAEFDALNHRNGYSVSDYGFTDTERASSWEFPILLKYRIPLHRIRPFAEAGVAPRTIAGTIDTQSYYINAMGTMVTSQSTHPTNWSASFGVVIGGGVRFDIGRLSLSPEVRYTHWTSTPIVDGGNNGPVAYSAQEQLEVLMCVGWTVHRSKENGK